MPGKSSGGSGRHQHVKRRKGRKMKAHKETGGEADGNEVFPEPEGETHQLLDVMQVKSTGHVTRPPSDVTENVWSISVQVFIPFLVAGFGMVGAGLVLDTVQHWKVFKVVSEVFILVPALLGLKGNLEMTLASRLSTQANLGYMDSPKEQWSIIIGNLALIQCQATVVGFLASLAAVIMGWVPEGKFDLAHGLLLCASSMITATLASLVLGLVMVAVIVISRHCNINPDNVATPIAASLGDLITLALLSWIASLLFDKINTQEWVAPLLILICNNVNENQQNFFSSHNNSRQSQPQTGSMPGAGDKYDNEVQCRCGGPAKRLIVQKEGPNKGRPFYTCPKSVDQCQFFIWGDEGSNDSASGSSSNWGRNNRGGQGGSSSSDSSDGRKRRKCGNCHEEGHTKRTCPNN